MLHVAVEYVGSGELDLRVFRGQVGHNGGDGHGDDGVQGVLEHGHHLVHHLQSVQVHLAVGVLQAWQELVKDLNTQT